MHAVGRIAYRGWIDNIQASWVKCGVVGARQILQAGANDLGGTLMDENISRAAGASHGQELDESEFRAIVEPLGRPLVQRTTLYGRTQTVGKRLRPPRDHVHGDGGDTPVVLLGARPMTPAGTPPTSTSSRSGTPSSTCSPTRPTMRTGRRFRLGDALVVAQVALSIVVLIGAGLLERTLHNLHSINPGFDPQNILLFGIDPNLAGYTDQQTQQLYANLQQRFAAIPGVISASYSEEALLSGGWSAGDVHIDGAPPKQYANTGELPVGLNFFSTMRIPMRAGRNFASADFAAAAAANAAEKARDAAAEKAKAAPSTSTPASPTALDEAYYHSAPVPLIVNEAFARTYLAKQNPIGLHMSDAPRGDAEVPNLGSGYTIIGVVGDTKYAQLRRKTAPIIFLPLVSNGAHFELRAAASPTALVKIVREIVSEAGDNLPLTDVRTQTEQIDQTLFQERLMARLSSFFGALALVLACIGLYGLLSYEVARRTRELGIRMTLGAQRRDLLRLIVGQGILLVLVGATIGIAAGLGVTRFISSMLYGLHANDPVTFAAVAILLMLVALAACYIPARRAMRVDPMVALRYE